MAQSCLFSALMLRFLWVDLVLMFASGVAARQAGKLRNPVTFRTWLAILLYAEAVKEAALATAFGKPIHM